MNTADCRILKPVLVAFVHGEEHPESAILLEHLRDCRSCRAEEAELRATLSLIELAFIPDAGSPAQRRGLARWLRARSWDLLPAAAGILLLSYLLISRMTEPRDDLAAARIHAGPTGLFGPSAVLASDSFLGEELDRRLEWLDRDLIGIRDEWTR